jgi:hypothetical protein
VSALGLTATIGAITPPLPKRWASSRLVSNAGLPGASKAGER